MNKNSLHNLNSLAALVQSGSPDAGRIISVSVDKVQSKAQVRKIFKNLDELAASMKAEGQQSAIIVSPPNADGMYTIQKGERRWRAAKLGEIEEVLIIVKELPENIVEEKAGELIENIQREDLTSMEIADALSVFIDNKWTQQDIATRLGKSKSFISAHLGLLKAPDCVRELHDEGFVTDTETLNILRLIHEKDANKCAALCKKALKENGISRKYCRDTLNEISDPAVTAPPAPAYEEAGSPNPYIANTDNTSGDPATLPAGEDARLLDHDYEGQSKALLDDSGPSGEHEDEEVVVTNIHSLDHDLHLEETNSPGQSDSDAPEEELCDNAEPTKWATVDPSDLVFNVTVKIRDLQRPGSIMLDRVAINPQFVWVFLTDERIGHLALIKDVTFLSVKKNPYRV